MSLIPLGFWAASGGGGGAGAFDLLETTTLASSAASVTFSGLDAYSDYKHLQIRAVTRADNASETNLSFMKWNGGDLTFGHELFGYSGSVSSGDAEIGGEIYAFTHPCANAPSNTYGAAIIDILDFASTSKNKTFRSLAGQNDSTFPRVQLVSGFLNSTSALTTVQFVPRGDGNYVANTRFSLYGIKG